MGESINRMDGKKGKVRLDIFLVDHKMVTSRSRARGEIMAGRVYVDGVRVDKPGTLVSPDARVELRQEINPYVSRGGLKLEKALHVFDIDLRGKIVLDVGASTGGFTHCALEHGAELVYALDVGYGQLAWELRNNPKVVNMERFNVRFLKREDLPSFPDVATIDVSFISLQLVLPVIASLGIGEVISLIKPQFEAGKEQVGKRGVVKDPKVHEEVLKKILALAGKLSYKIEGLTFSPIKSPRGNVEYILYLKKVKAEKEKDFFSETEKGELIKKIISQAGL